MYRLCLRNLRVYGVARIDLMKQAQGLVVNSEVMSRLRGEASGAVVPASDRPAGQ